MITGESTEAQCGPSGPDTLIHTFSQAFDGEIMIEHLIGARVYSEQNETKQNKTRWSAN